jgi:hypothetical protein
MLEGRLRRVGRVARREIVPLQAPENVSFST